MIKIWNQMSIFQIILPANAILLACPLTSLRIAKVWHADLTTSIASLCWPMEDITKGINPKEETYNNMINNWVNNIIKCNWVW